MAIDKLDFDTFMNQARIKLPGASDSGIKTELYDVIKEFLSDSNSWFETLTVAIIAGTQTYQLLPKYDGQIIRLVAVYDKNNIPQAAFMPEFGVMQLVNPVSNDQTFTVTVTKNITQPTTKNDIPVAPDWLLRVYSIAILDGLLGKMMGQLSKSYSNPTMSMYHLRRFRTEIQMARVAAMRQNTLGAQAWSFPKFFRTRGQRGGVSTGNPTAF